MSGRDGGSAAPWTEFEQQQERGEPPTIYFQNPGMSMRQFYKASALQQILWYRERNGAEFGYQNPQSMAHECGLIADAMLAEDAEFAKETPGA